jgi:hypothetical protein
MLACLGAWLASAPASAVSLAFTGTLSFQLATLAPITFGGSGTAVVNGSGPAGHLTGLSLSASAFALSGYVLPVTDPAAYPIAGVKATIHNGAATFAGSGGAGFGGTMPLIGVAKVCLFAACGTAGNVANLSVPLSVVGQGGTVTVMGPANATVYGAPWTTGTAAVGVITEVGGVSPLSSTGASSGTLSLVTPIRIFGGFENTPAFARLTLHFVPEPGTLALLGGGVCVLAVFGRRRRV